MDDGVSSIDESLDRGEIAEFAGQPFDGRGDVLEAAAIASGSIPTAQAMNLENRSDSDALPNLGVNPGYVLGRLAKALQTSETDPDPATRERAHRKIAKWVSVYEGLLSGALRVGSRTPIADTPAWATLEIAHGGFATGSLRAGGPLQPHEHARLSRLPAVPEGTERSSLNASYLTDEGLAELGQLLDTGSTPANSSSARHASSRSPPRMHSANR